MSQLVTVGCKTMCTFGTMPSDLIITSNQTVTTEGKPVATIADSAGPSNLGTYGMCTSLANPAVASATAAALGVLTPQPCMPTPAGTWIPTGTNVIIGGQPCLTNDCKMMCAFAGSISIVTPGQFKVTRS